MGNGWIELERPLPYDVHPDWGVSCPCRGLPCCCCGLLSLRPAVPLQQGGFNRIVHLLLTPQSRCRSCAAAMCQLFYTLYVASPTPCQVAVHSFEHPVQHVGYENFSVEFKFGKAADRWS